MSNDLQEVGYTMPSGKIVYVPSASVSQYVLCGHPKCRAVHLFLLDNMQQPIAEATLSRAMLENMLMLVEAIGG